MRVAYLTAGAGGMYCGSCMRDNTLAAALRRHGRDVQLIPVYSPIRTDEDDVSESRVYFGGINVYLSLKSALFRRMPAWVHRLLDAPGLLRLATRRIGSTPPKTLGDLVVSILRGDAGRQRRELDQMLDALAELRPDVVHLPDAFFVGIARATAQRLGASIVCTLTGEDIFLDQLGEAHRNEAVRLIREGAAAVDAFITVTKYYGQYAADSFGIAAERIHHVPIGVRMEPDGFAHDQPAGPARDRADDSFTVGYLARICPEKGLHILADAFIRLHQQGRRCRLAVAGYQPAAQRRYLEEIRRRLKKAGLAGYVDHLGEVDRAGKLRLLRACDVFSVPTVYRESKGIYVIEAMAQGVPVVQPRHGSFPELIEATGGGILFEPDSAQALAEAIAGLMDDPVTRRRLGDQGREAARESFTDEMMADRAWQVFEAVRPSVARPSGDPAEPRPSGRAAIRPPGAQ